MPQGVGPYTGRMSTRLRAAVVLCALVLAGLAFGALTSVINHSPGWEVASKIIGVGWSWAAVGILVGAVARRRRARAVLTVLLAAVAGYYLADLAVGSYNTIDFDDPRAAADPMNAAPVTDWSGAALDVVFWAVGAAVVSWPLARIGVATRRGDVWGLLARLAIPLGAAFEVLALRLPGELAVQPNPRTVFVYVAVAAAGLVVAVVITVLHVQDVPWRSAAAVLWASAIVAGAGLGSVIVLTFTEGLKYRVREDQGLLPIPAPDLVASMTYAGLWSFSFAVAAVAATGIATLVLRRRRGLK